MRVPVRKQGKPSGFTLVEMAIVLVIIGIILAGVMKGRDIVRGAQVKQFSQQFAQKWATVCQTYYDKTGRFLDDGTTNGGSAATADGKMDGSAPASALTIVTACQNVGITPCSLVKSKISGEFGTATIVPYATVAGHCQGGGTAGANIFETLVEGEFFGNARVQADLANVVVTVGATGTTTTFSRNTVVLYNVPTDVAIGLDTVIDGTADGQAGAVVNLNTGTALTPNITALTYTTAIVTAVWPAATTGQSHVVGILMDF